MASCKFCLNANVDTWFGNWCTKCHKLQRIIALFSIEKVMGVLENVLIVDEETQKDKVKDELKSILTTREYNLRKKKENLKEQEK
jgi:hypothetical protein